MGGGVPFSPPKDKFFGGVPFSPPKVKLLAGELGLAGGCSI